MDKKHILSTKLYKPPVRGNNICREKLNKKLDESLQKNHKIILVSAPAGYGKTTLISEWASQLDYSCAWLSLDEYDNEPVRFINYLLAAVQKVNDDFGTAIENFMAAPKLPGVRAVSSYISEELEQIQKPLILVLDDYHVINNEYINTLVQNLLDSMAPGIITVIITRQEPSITLSRWRAGDRITELNATDLKFGEEEIKEFYERYFNMAFDDDMLQIIERQTEGWAAGMQLTGLSIKNMEKNQARSFIEEFSGSNRFIADYLLDEVLGNQEEQIRNFLISTCILNRFNEELCNNVLGIKGSGKIIKQLEKENLFIISLDNSYTWYRYHHIFSEYLRTSLDEHQEIEINRKASQWCRENGFFEEAMEYSLKANDGEAAESLLKQEAAKFLKNGEMKSLLFWLNSIAAIKKDRAAIIDVYRIICLFITEEINFDYSMPKNQNILERIKDDQVATGLLQAAVSIFCINSDKEKASELSEKAVMNLKDSHEFYYYAALLSKGMVKSKNGCIDEAVTVLKEVYSGIHGKGYRFLELVTLSNLAVNLNFLGKRKEALVLCEEALEEHKDKKGSLLPMARILYQPIGILLYYNNMLDEAWRYMDENLTYCKEAEFSFTTGVGEWYYILLLYNKGKKDIAMEMLYKLKTRYWSLKNRQAIELLKGLGSGLYIREMNHNIDLFEALETELHIKEKNFQKVITWLGDQDTISKVSGLTTSHAYLTFIRALILQGSLQEAEVALLEQEKLMRQHRRYGELITVLLLAALVKNRMGKVKEALIIAAPEGYIRNFLDEDDEILSLVYKAREAAPEFVDRLLGIEGMPSEALDKTLSIREIEILKLIAEGMSNGEIAAMLYITTGTVKWHIKNIYCKLGVNKRIQAVEMARQLGIISVT